MTQDPLSSLSSGKSSLPLMHFSLGELESIDTAFSCLDNEYELDQEERDLWAKILRMIRQMRKDG